MPDFDPIRVILDVRDLLRDIDDDHAEYAPQRQQLEQLLRWAMRQQDTPPLSKRDLESIIAVRNAMAGSLGSGTDIDCFESEIDTLSGVVNRSLGLAVLTQVSDVHTPAEG
jgi:hypothetical protein